MSSDDDELLFPFSGDDDDVAFSISGYPTQILHLNRLAVSCAHFAVGPVDWGSKYGLMASSEGKL